MSKKFIEQHGLWTEAQKAAAVDVLHRAEEEGLQIIRLSWPDQYGLLRGIQNQESADGERERHLVPALRWQNYRGDKCQMTTKTTINSMAGIVRRPIRFIPQLAPLMHSLSYCETAASKSNCAFFNLRNSDEQSS